MPACIGPHSPGDDPGACHGVAAVAHPPWPRQRHYPAPIGRPGVPECLSRRRCHRVIANLARSGAGCLRRQGEGHLHRHGHRSPCVAGTWGVTGVSAGRAAVVGATGQTPETPKPFASPGDPVHKTPLQTPPAACPLEGCPYQDIPAPRVCCPSVPHNTRCRSVNSAFWISGLHTGRGCSGCFGCVVPAQ
jgi:hypothetical protein